MYAVTWQFDDTRQQRNYKDILAAERKARELKRFGCRQVKIIAFEQQKKKVVDKSKSRINTNEAWAAIDALSKPTIESIPEMGIEVDAPAELARERWAEGRTKAQIVGELNEKFEPTFYQTTSGIWAVNDPDYLPEVQILACVGRDQ